MKIRDASPDELAAKPKAARPPSPRQLALMKRERTIEKALNELGAGPSSMIKRVDVENDEKLATIRLAIATQIRRSRSSVRIAVRAGAIYLSRSAIPGSRGRTST